MTRPATFRCTWCGETKALKRTGRMPRFCSDACRRAPVTAERALANARWHKESAERTIAHYESHLERFRLLEHARTQAERSGDAGDAGTGSDPRPRAETRSGAAIAAETR